MRYIKYIYIIIASFLLLAGNIEAQDKQVSTTVRWENGKKYYIHIVSQGQGLYTIAKLYAVTEKDILENNPSAFDGLKPGQELKIPFIKQPIVPKGYKIHIIEKGQTVYSISKQYHITVKKIFDANPELKNGYKIDQKIKIPIRSVIENKPNIDDKPLVKGKKHRYKVKKKDTLYGLSKKFNLSTEQLLEANPCIKEEGLRKGQKIIIPQEEKIDTNALYLPVDTFKYADTSLMDLNRNCDTNHIEQREIPLNVSLLLPFSINIEAFQLEKENTENVQAPYFKEKHFFEFYQGILLALKELKAQNYRINLSVFDTKNDSLLIKKIIQRPNFRKSNLIIGPIYKKNYRAIQQYADSLHIPLINPIVKATQLSEKSSYTIDVFPDKSVIMNQTVKLLPFIDSSRFYIIHSGFTDGIILSQELKNTAKQYFIEHLKDSTLQFSELVFTENKIEGLGEKLSKDKKNFIIIASKDQAFVSNIITNLNFLAEDYDITLLAWPEWKRYKNINVQYFHRLNLMQISSEFVDFTEPKAIAFTKQYRKYYNQEPNRFAFLGHDIAHFFISYFYQNDRFDCLNHFNDSSLLNMKFHFIKNKKGLVNDHFYILHYGKDYTISNMYSITNNVTKE